MLNKFKRFSVYFISLTAFLLTFSSLQASHNLEDNKSSLNVVPARRSSIISKIDSLIYLINSLNTEEEKPKYAFLLDNTSTNFAILRQQFGDHERKKYEDDLREQVKKGREKEEELLFFENNKNNFMRVTLEEFSNKQGHIPNFRGNTYSKEGGVFEKYLYEKDIEQYATTSYPKEKMLPFLIAHPEDSKDIIAAIKYAKEKGKHIVARSGGHHYTGKSSGGNDTIVLDMNAFKFKTDVSEKIRKNADLVEVSPAVRLHELNKYLTKQGLSVPHGECPYVAIGGHAQTGGYGHFLRSFGLNADYIEEFDIVLANGKEEKEPKEYNIIRPKPNDNDTFNQDIFKAVLSGNAGSFGIVTKYAYNPIKDTDHPESRGFTKTREYDFLVFKDLMQEVKFWTEMIAKGKDEKDLKGLDFMMTLESRPFSQYTWPLSSIPSQMIVELVYSDLDKGVSYSGQFDSIINKATQGMSKKEKCISNVFDSSFLDGSKIDIEDRTKLSKLSHHFVRRFPQVTIGNPLAPSIDRRQYGREFSLPYKKRINVTTNALTYDFIDKFSEQIDKTMNEEGIHLVFQMAFGGGAYKAKGDIVTAFPHRDAVWNFVYDLFYEDGKKQKAIELQKEMQTIVNEYFNNDKQERRLFWGTFGNTNMKDPKVQKMYYNDDNKYEYLQKIKAKYDPDNIFHTDLTVQLPEDDQKES